MKIKIYNAKEHQEPELMVDSEDLKGAYNWKEAQEQIELLNSLNYKGFNNWRLPTKDELNDLYDNKDVIGGFSSLYYWSSTENGYNSSWSQYFFSGSQYFYNKINFHRVRCVRSFTNQ